MVVSLTLELAGLGVMAIFRPLGIAMAGGAALGLYASAIEKRVRFFPANNVELPADDGKKCRDK